MILRALFKSSGSSSAQNFRHRPLLHVLGQGQTPKDFEDPIEYNFRSQDVIISRAELDLRRATQSLMIHTHSTVSSLAVLTALELPGSTAALFWVIRLLLDDKLPGSAVKEQLILNRNRDSRLLYKALSSVDLDHWYETQVDKAVITAMPAGLQFLPGHPIPQRYYRKHPLPAKQQVYLPVASYFSELFHERKQELIRLLANLGATRIQIEDLGGKALVPTETLEYPGKLWTPGLGLNSADYAWLPYEPSWQAVIANRSAGDSSAASFDLTIDINGMITNQVSALKNLIAQLNSVESADHESSYLGYLQPKRVSVKF
ncbi:MAG: hypothetical protein ACFCVD_10310 [Nodosilinea sp.]